MRTYLGILGDPAKIDLYPVEFYEILKETGSNSIFHLIGASENNVSKNEYQLMYQQFKSRLQNINCDPILNLSSRDDTSFRSRIGLFPSSSRHLVRGPSFIFAPYPVNSSSLYLKFKSRFLSRLLSPFIKAKIHPLAYYPLGGKAANKTKANQNISNQSMIKEFYDLRKKSKFNWYYLEAGSGEKSLTGDLIQKILLAQSKSILNVSFTEKLMESILVNAEIYDRLIVPGAIYGGGIRDVKKVEEILLPRGEHRLVPQIIIIGNISEEEISTTYRIVAKVDELNKLHSEEITNIDLD